MRDGLAQPAPGRCVTPQGHTPTLGRRRCLQFVLALPAAVQGSVWQQPALAASDPLPALSNLSRLVAPAQAGSVGDAVLPGLGHPTAEALVLALVARLSVVARIDLTGVCTTATLHRALQQAVSADFAEGRCVTVGGWVLTRTEAELCAWAALSRESA